MNCAIYCRVSTEEQAVGGHSIEAQRMELLNYCKAYDYDIYDTFIDAGFSASTMDRPALRNLLEQSPHFDIALVWRLDRISRDMGDLMKILEIFDANNVSFKSKMESFDTATASGKLMLNMLGSFAEFERASISERIKMAQHKMLVEGNWRGGPPPFGYKLNVRKLLEICHSEADIVRDIFNMSTEQNFGSRTIALQLNSMGYTTRTGKKFSSPYISKILKNPIYYGKMISGRQKCIKKGDRKQVIYTNNFEIFDGNFEAIIPQAIFEKSQQLSAARKLNRGLSASIASPLSGLVFCGNCTKHMTRSKNSKGEVFFTCSNYKNLGNCTHHYISERRIFAEIKKSLATIKLSSSQFTDINSKLCNVSLEPLTKIAHQFMSLKRRTDMLESRLDKLFELVEESVITQDDFINRRSIIVDKIVKNKALYENIASYENTSTHGNMHENTSTHENMYENTSTHENMYENINSVNSLVHKFDTLSPLIKKAVINILINRIEIFDADKPYGKKKIEITLSKLD